MLITWFYCNKTYKEGSCYHEIIIARNGVWFQGEVFKGIVENRVIHVMNGDKQLVMVSESHEKTPVGFGALSIWKLPGGLSLLPSAYEHFLFASSKNQLKTLKKKNSKLKLMAFTWSQLGSVLISWHCMVLAGLRESHQPVAQVT